MYKNYVQTKNLKIQKIVFFGFGFGLDFGFLDFLGLGLVFGFSLKTRKFSGSNLCALVKFQTCHVHDDITMSLTGTEKLLLQISF